MSEEEQKYIKAVSIPVSHVYRLREYIRKLWEAVKYTEYPPDYRTVWVSCDKDGAGFILENHWVRSSISWDMDGNEIKK